MRTTVSLDDELLIMAKSRAGVLGLTLGQYVERAIRLLAASDADRVAGPPLPVFRDGTGARAGVDLDSNRALHEVLDDTLALDKLR